MKKTLFFAAVAALFTFASCQKEVAPVQNQGEDPVFTATIASQSTKTTVDAATAKVAWVNEDEITITDAASTSAKYKVSAINEGRATFTKVDGQPTLGAGPYSAVYGTAPEASQTYSATAPSLPMSAKSSTTSLEFAVTCGLLELNLTAGESVTSIEVTGTEATYTLTCSTPVSIASGAKFFIALPAGSYTSFLINGQNGAICKKEKSGESVAIAANHITPVSFSNALHFAVQLWADGPYWATTNIGAATPEAYGRYFAWGDVTGQTWNPGWSGVGFGDYVPYEIENNNLKPAYDAAVQNWGDPWRMPTSAELGGLKNNCTATKTSLGGVSGVRFTGKGQGYTDKSIFIPYGGSSNLSGNSIEELGSAGYCWSTTFAGNKSSYYFSIYDQAIADYWRKTAMSVRPVYSEAAAPTTGTAMAHINGIDVEVAWVQLWADGPKFAKCNYGAASQSETSKGTKVNYSTACTSLWGSTWKTPSGEEMDLLNTTKVTCTYCEENGVCGFKFTGVQEGYTGNSLFLPAGEGDSDFGEAYYCSSTAVGSSGAWILYLYYCYGSYNSDWISQNQSDNFYVRPVLSN